MRQLTYYQIPSYRGSELVNRKTLTTNYIHKIACGKCAGDLVYIIYIYDIMQGARN